MRQRMDDLMALRCADSLVVEIDCGARLRGPADVQSGEVYRGCVKSTREEGQADAPSSMMGIGKTKDGSE